MKVALLNAHTAYSPGAMQELRGLPTSEYYWSSKINQHLLQLINDNYPESESAIIDTSNVKPYPKSLRYKAFFVKRDKYDLAVETHLNSAVAPLATGIEVLYSRVNYQAKLLALDVATALGKFLPFKLRHGDGTVERNNLFILKISSCPVIINEILFLSNKNDKLYLTHPRSAEIIANAIYAGLVTYISNRGDDNGSK